MTGEEFLKNSVLGDSVTEDRCAVCNTQWPKAQHRLWLEAQMLAGGEFTYGNIQICNSIDCCTVMAQTECECSKCAGGPTTVH